MDRKTLFIIPARGGSKGIPHKNIKDFCGRPLITYTIDIARKFTDDQHICVSTDDQKIVSVVENYGLKVPFIRPAELATDTASTNEVLLHAIKFYEEQGLFYDQIVLLQPTSPLRKEEHIKEALKLFSKKLDMVVSVCKTDVGSVLCKDDEAGFIKPIFNKDQSRRQDTATLYVYNGAIYIINVKSLKDRGLSNFDKKIKYIMPQEYSVDIDTLFDWSLASFLFQNEKE